MTHKAEGETTKVKKKGCGLVTTGSCRQSPLHELRRSQCVSKYMYLQLRFSVGPGARSAAKMKSVLLGQTPSSAVAPNDCVILLGG